MCSTMQIHCQAECPYYMVKQCNIYGQTVHVQQIYGQIWFQNHYGVQMHKIIIQIEQVYWQSVLEVIDVN